MCRAVTRRWKAQRWSGESCFYQYSIPRSSKDPVHAVATIKLLVPASPFFGPGHLEPAVRKSRVEEARGTSDACQVSFNCHEFSYNHLVWSNAE